MRKLLCRIGIVFTLLIIHLYVSYVAFLPGSIILMQGESLNLKTVFGVTVQSLEENGSTLQASSNINKSKINDTGTMDVSFNLFGRVPVKTLTVNVIPKTTVIPIGKTIGMKLYTDGVLVVGMSEVGGKRPYENSGIQEGDRIVEINHKKIDSTNDLIGAVNESNGDMVDITYQREEATLETSITPAKTSENEYKLGLWVRDAAAGVGTITFYEPSSGCFAALGHGITDIDTSELISIANGELVTTQIISVVKGEKGAPGEIRGTIENSIVLGNVSKNTRFGVYGNITNGVRLNINQQKEKEVALREEIKTGKAKILCQLDNQNIKEYDIEIQKLFLNNNEDNKSMLIKITDEELLEKTGGIIQGMSGAPIIQNGKFVGAVTHVLVNDPTSGYGVFADMMIKELREAN